MLPPPPGLNRCIVVLPPCSHTTHCTSRSSLRDRLLFLIGLLRWLGLFPQILGKVYAVLSDPEQRTLYDQQGVVDEESTVLSQVRNWEEYWKLIFKEVGNLSQTGESVEGYLCGGIKLLWSNCSLIFTFNAFPLCLSLLKIR